MKGIVLTDHRKDAFETAYIKLGGIGKRVLRFCDFILPKAKHPTGNPFEPDEKNSPRRSPICWTYVYHRSSLSCCTRWCCHLSICWYQGDHVTGDYPITAKASAKLLKSSLGKTNPSLAWLIPSKDFWPDDEVLVQTEETTSLGQIVIHLGVPDNHGGGAGETWGWDCIPSHLDIVSSNSDPKGSLSFNLYSKFHR